MLILSVHLVLFIQLLPIIQLAEQLLLVSSGAHCIEVLSLTSARGVGFETLVNM